MTWAKIGMKVVCVKGPAKTFTLLPVCQPEVGSVYTIRGLFESASNPGKIGVLLEEIWNPTSPKWGHEYGLFLDRFRPFVPKRNRSDIAVFKRIADQVPNMEDVE